MYQIPQIYFTTVDTPWSSYTLLVQISLGLGLPHRQPLTMGSCSSLMQTKSHCGCLTRQLPPIRPDTLPFEPKEENTKKMKGWLLARFGDSTFNKCPHQTLPMMTGPPIKIHIDPTAIPVAVHTPALTPIHWCDEIKEQLDTDVRLGVTTWCHRAIWTRKPDGGPRRVVDLQSLNLHCIRDTHHTVPPFQQARTIPPDTFRTVTDAWNGYHSVPVCEENRHLLTFITEFGRYRYCRTTRLLGQWRWLYA